MKMLYIKDCIVHFVIMGGTGHIHWMFLTSIGQMVAFVKRYSDATVTIIGQGYKVAFNVVMPCCCTLR
jgi:hypothetical protein